MKIENIKILSIFKPCILISTDLIYLNIINVDSFLN